MKCIIVKIILLLFLMWLLENSSLQCGSFVFLLDNVDL